MATSDVDIASQAMLLIRANTISAFDDGTNEADIASELYDDFVRDILTRYRWSFCTKKVQFAQDATAPLNEYTYSHVIPGDVLKIYAIYSSSQSGARPLNDYDIQSPDGDERIFSNSSTIYADYTYYLDESKWPSYFVNFAIKAFAAHVATPIGVSARIKNDVTTAAWGTPSENENGGAFSKAANLDQQMRPQEAIYDSPFISQRFS